jgi:cell division protein FtsW
MGYVVGLLPVTGVQLPLISAGGTSLVLTLFIVGLLARFARSEPAAIEAQRVQSRGRVARFLLPVPAAAVDPVRLHRRAEERAPARPAGGARTVLRTRSAPSRPDAPRAAASRATSPRGAAAEPAPARDRAVPPRERRPAGNGARAAAGRRQQPPSGAPRRPGGLR